MCKIHSMPNRVVGNSIFLRNGAIWIRRPRSCNQQSMVLHGISEFYRTGSWISRELCWADRAQGFGKAKKVLLHWLRWPEWLSWPFMQHSTSISEPIFKWKSCTIHQQVRGLAQGQNTVLAPVGFFLHWHILQRIFDSRVRELMDWEHLGISQALESHLPVAGHGAKDIDIHQNDPKFELCTSTAFTTVRQTLSIKASQVWIPLVPNCKQLNILAKGYIELIESDEAWGLQHVEDKQTGAERVLARMKKGLLALTGAERFEAEHQKSDSEKQLAIHSTKKTAVKIWTFHLNVLERDLSKWNSWGAALQLHRWGCGMLG